MGGKISRAQGPSVSFSDAPIQHMLSRRPVLGGAPSVGTNSLPSSEKEAKSDNEESQNPPRVVRTTESPSSQMEPTGDSDANSTDGNSQTTQNPPSDESTPDSEAPKKVTRPAKRATKAVPRKAGARSTDDEDDF